MNTFPAIQAAISASSRIVLLASFCASLLFSPPVLGQAPTAKLNIYTEVRDGSDIISDELGNSWVDSPSSRIMRAMLEESGLEFQVSVVPWSRILKGLETESNALAYPVLRTPEREDRFHWLGLIRPIEANLCGMRNRLDELPRTLSDARDFRIGVIRGDSFDDYLRAAQMPNIVYIGNNTPMFSMLERNRIDLMPFTQFGIDLLLQGLQLPSDTLVPVIRLDALSRSLYFVMGLDSDPELVERVSLAYRRIVENGTFERLEGFPHPGF